VLSIERSASRAVGAPPERCMAVLADVGAYPAWSGLIVAARVVERDAKPARVWVRAQVLGLTVEMDCLLELGEARAVLRRVPDDDADRERYDAVWTVSPREGGTEVELEVTALLDAPGPAALLRGRVGKRLVDDVLEEFARAL
jgi:ribosome-associated toxin RatA of RatAB toxin-antitoxin module